MKRSIIIVAAMALLLSAGPLFAEGAQEDGTVRINPWGDTVTLTGKVYASFTGHPELKTADGKTYELMFPMFLAEGLDLSNGETITVEGAEVPGGYGFRRTDADETSIRVIKATVDGKTYDLSETFGYGGPGGAGGRMGGRADRGGMMGGPYGNPPGRGGFQTR